MLVKIVCVGCFSYDNMDIPNELVLKISNPNKVILRGKIDSIVIANLINQIDLLTESNSDKNVFVIIDSIGGDLIQGIKFINWMEKSKSDKNLRFECVCVNVISTAFNIFQLCDYRYVIDSCLMIQHEPKINIEGTFDFVSNYFLNDFTKHLNMYNQIVNKVSHKLGLNQSQYVNKFANGDWIITNTNQMLLNNLANEKI